MKRMINGKPQKARRIRHTQKVSARRKMKKELISSSSKTDEQ